MSLFTFLNLAEYEQKLNHHLPAVFLWQIRQMTIKTRLSAIKTYSCFLQIKEIAQTKKIKFTEAEALSWLDNIIIIKRLIDRFSYKEQISLALDLEYELLPSKRRIDCLISCADKYFILECSFCEDTLKHADEIKQAKGYKKALVKKFKDVKVDCDILPFKPEYSQNKVLLSEALEYNEQLLKELHEKITNFFNI